MPNVTYINDLLDLDDPNQKGAFNKIAAKESIKVLPPPGHGAFNEPYNQHNDISDFNKPHLSNPYVNEKFTSITTLPEFENQPNMGPPNMGPPNMGQPNMGPPNMGPPNMGPPNMGPPNMGQPNMGPPNMGQPNMGPPNMGPIPETYMNQPNKKQNVGIENPGMKGNPGKPGIEKFNIAGPINPQVNRQVVQQNVSKSEKKHKSKLFENFNSNSKPSGFFKKIIKYKEKENFTDHNYSCMDIAEHIAYCPICSKLYKKNDVPFIITIVVLVIIIIFLGKNIYDLKTK